MSDPHDTRQAVEEARLQGLRVEGAATGLCASCRHATVTVCEIPAERDGDASWKPPTVLSIARCAGPRSAFTVVTWRVIACAEFASPTAEA
jgi:hypothetical protein